MTQNITVRFTNSEAAEGLVPCADEALSLLDAQVVIENIAADTEPGGGYTKTWVTIQDADSGRSFSDRLDIYSPEDERVLNLASFYTAKWASHLSGAFDRIYTHESSDERTRRLAHARVWRDAFLGRSSQEDFLMACGV